MPKSLKRNYKRNKFKKSLKRKSLKRKSLKRNSLKRKTYRRQNMKSKSLKKKSLHIKKGGAFECCGGKPSEKPCKTKCEKPFFVAKPTYPKVFGRGDAYSRLKTKITHPDHGSDAEKKIQDAEDAEVIKRMMAPAPAHHPSIRSRLEKFPPPEPLLPGIEKKVDRDKRVERDRARIHSEWIAERYYGASNKR